jgi:hypothetical protein
MNLLTLFMGEIRMKIGTIGINFTRPFWGGLLIGLSFGLYLGGALVEHMALDGGKVVIPSIVLVVAGVLLARKAPDGT